MQEPLLEKVLRRFRLSRVLPHIDQGDVLLDVGCGWEAKALRELAPRLSKGIGIDFKVEPFNVPSHIKLVATRFEAADWPVGEAECDKAIMLAVLEHIEPALVGATLKNIRRALKPGGKLILTVPTPPAQPVLEFLSYKLGVINEAEIRDHKLYYDRPRLERTLSENGFTIERYKTFQLGMNSFCVASRA
ncbi:MAG TPA: class I SAM-dependent methyltransferase [Bdellovibrionales bacterium]|nr:class I SAM-dependent methyltransferase [Bdellovibrionales bacterium]